MKKQTNLLRTFYTLLDGVIIFFSYYCAEWLWIKKITHSGNFLLGADMRKYVFAAVIVYAVFYVLACTITGIYRSFRYRSIWNIWIKNTLIHAVMIGATMMLLFAFRLQDISRGSLLLFLGIVSLALLIKNLIGIGLLRCMRAIGYNQKHVIVVGSGELARDYAATVEENSRYGITIDGFISNSGESMTDAPALGRYLGTNDALEELIHSHGIDEVIIALDDPKARDVFSVIECCENCGTRVCIIPYYNSMISSVPSINIVGRMKCFELRTSPLDGLMNRTVKRAFDIVFSLIILLLISPIMLLTAIGVKLSSPGPVFFKQERVGKDKKLFTMYKFRSMRVNADSNTAWSKDVDPRKTRFGSFIRKFSIDELPQFFNVLKGDMSVIGPRPEIPHYVEQFRESIPKYMLKHLVRPGITGWAQVNGYRGDTSIEERIRHDIWYIENWTVGLDIKILFRTVFGGMINSEKTN